MLNNYYHWQVCVEILIKEKLNHTARIAKC